MSAVPELAWKGKGNFNETTVVNIKQETQFQQKGQGCIHSNNKVFGHELIL